MSRIVVISIIFILLFINNFFSQCNGEWEQVYHENFEYENQIAGIVPNSVYHYVPQTYSPYSGTKAMYLNFVDGYTGLAYNNNFNVCIGSVSKISFWFKDAWGASNNFDVKIFDANGNLIQSQNYNITNNNSWNQFVSNEITVTTSTISLQIINHLTIGGNDLVVDDIIVEACSQSSDPILDTLCLSDNNINLKNYLPSNLTGGIWQGPTATSNGDLGTINLNNINAFGTYNYKIPINNACPSINNYVTISVDSSLFAGNDTNLIFCSKSETGNLFDYIGTSNQNGVWKGPSTLINGYQGSFNLETHLTGIYHYISTSSNPSCPNDTAFVNISIDSVPSIYLGSDTNICINDTILLDAGVSNFFYLWNNGDTSQTISVFNSGLYYVSVSNTNCTQNDTIQITVQNLPEINLGNDTTICENSSITLNALNPNYSHLWSNGSTNQTITINSPNTYAVTVTDHNGCVNSDSINIFTENIQNAGNDSSVILCNSQQTFDVNTMIQAGANNDIWSLIINNDNFNLNTGILSLTTEDSVIILNIDVSNICPNDTSIYTIKIYEQGNAGLDNQQNICNDSIINLNTILSNNSSNGFWEEITNSQSFNTLTGEFDANNLPSKVYKFNYITHTNYPCIQDTSTFNINVLKVYEPKFVTQDTIGCSPHKVHFINQSDSGNYQCNWSFGDGNSSTNCGNVSYTYTQPGVYNVTLTITNQDICVNQYKKDNYIKVVSPPTASFFFEPKKIFSFEPVVNFSNTSINATNYFWNFGYNNQTSVEKNPSHTFPELIEKKYAVSLVARNNIGCADTLLLNVEIINDVLIFVPNSFTPDGDDFNDFFKPILASGIDLNSYTLEIYNRWGEMIFLSKNPEVGWDGKYKGINVSDGVYLWKIYFKHQFSDKKEIKIGLISLIK